MNAPAAVALRPRPDLLELPTNLRECETLRVELDSTIIELSNKLDVVRRRSAIDQVFADSDWYSRATAKLRYLRRDQQRLMRHVAELNKAERLQANSVDLVLLRELRKALGEEAYQDRCAQALAVLLGPVAWPEPAPE
jgi:hypothetical protein